MTNEDLTKQIEAQRSLMMAVATGGPRIETVNGEYMDRRATIASEILKRELADPNPHADLWSWYGKWSSGELPTYATRRAHLLQMYDPLLDSLRRGPSVAGTPATPDTPRNGWSASPVFISYSHDSKEHKQWVLILAERLRQAGIDVGLDQWELRFGMDIPAFMERALAQAEKVLVVLTESYVQKANNRHGGVGYETMIVAAELLSDLHTTKFIPIVRQVVAPVLPRGFGSRYFVDFSDDALFEERVDELVGELNGEHILRKPPLGQPARRASAQEGQTRRAAEDPIAGDKSRWRELLIRAQTERLWIELENRVLVESCSAHGVRTRSEGELAGFISVRSVADHVFELGVPVQGRGGITIVATPFVMVSDVWMGAEGRLHVALKKDVLLKEGTSVFV